jgi:tetratricopeptide (TPR) repeat protein
MKDLTRNLSRAAKSWRSPATAAFLNVSGLGVGYGYVGAVSRLLAGVTVSMALIGIGIAVHTAGGPVVWISLLGAWVVAMAFDGWRIARRNNSGLPIIDRRRRVIHVVVALLLVGLLVATYLAYLEQGRNAFQRIEAHYTKRDCSGVSASYRRIRVPYDWTFDRNRILAERSYRECSQVLAARALRAERKYSEAAAAFRTFLRVHGGSNLLPIAREGLAEAELRTIQKLRSEGKYSEAVDAYREFLQMYSGSDLAPIAREGLAEAELRVGDELRQQPGNMRTAFRKYLSVVQELPDSSASQEARLNLVEVYNEETSPYFRKQYCSAVGPAKYYAELQLPEFNEIPGYARSIRPWAMYGCVVERYYAKDKKGAEDALTDLRNAYPGSNLVKLAEFVFSGNMEKADGAAIWCEATAFIVGCLCARRAKPGCVKNAWKAGNACATLGTAIDVVQTTRDCLPTFDSEACKDSALEVLGDMAVRGLPMKLKP